MNQLTLDEMMKRFRLASRELFNHYFHFPEDISGAPEVWDRRDRFSQVEKLLFEKMVCEPVELAHVEYGKLQPEIAVKLNSPFCPIMLNREASSGYWDFPLKEVTDEARLLFLEFFDWDQLAYRDHRYVRVQVGEWPSHPETPGKHALIESQYVRFERAT